MKVRQFTPQSPLPGAKNFLAVEIDAAVFNQRMPAPPDPFPLLFINCGAPLLWAQEHANPVELPRVAFFKPQTKPIRVWATGDCQVIGINLYSWGTRFFVDAQTDLTAPITPLDGVWRDFARGVEVSFQHNGEAEAIATLEQFVSDLRGSKEIDVGPVRRAVELLDATNGQCSLEEIAAQAFLSPSQLERRFHSFVGVSPKSLARLFRLDALLNAWRRDPARPIVDLVYRFGYCDQAHFTHEFKAFTSHTPYEYMAHWRNPTQHAVFYKHLCASVPIIHVFSSIRRKTHGSILSVRHN